MAQTLLPLPPDDSSEAEQQTIKSLSLEELAKIEVTTQAKEPEQVWNTAAAISVLTQDDIHRIGATNIPDLIRMLPGVFVGSANSNQWAVGVRGFTSNFSKSLLVLIDGRSVYTPLFGGVYWHEQDTLLEDIERIEVIRGPGGTIWGENAVNGIINIITKRADNTHGVLSAQTSGNLERYHGGLRVGGNAGQGFHFRIYGKGFLRGHQLHPDADNYDSWHMQRAGFRTDWLPTKHDTLTFQGDIYRGITPRRVGVTNTEDPVSGGNLLARYIHSFGSGNSFYVQTYVDHTNRGGIVGGVYQTTWDLDTILRLRVHPRNTVTVGAGYRYNPREFRQHTPTTDFVPHSENYLLYSFFAQDEIGLLPNKLTLTAGMKAEHNRFTGWELQPTGRLLFRANDHTSAWGAVTRAVRIPSQLETNFRLIGPVAPTLEVLVTGNKKFESEVLLGYEAGYRHLWGSRFYLDVAGFFNNYGRLQGFLPTYVAPDPLEPAVTALTIQYGNTIKGSTRGIEFAPDFKVNSVWRLSGSYSLLRYNLRSRPGFNDAATIAGYTGSSPLHQVMVQSRIDLPHHWEFDQTLRHTGSLPAQKVPGYTTGDLRLGWHRGGWDLSVNGRDLMENGHKEFAAGDDLVPTLGIRRSVFGKIVWTSKPQ